MPVFLIWTPNFICVLVKKRIVLNLYSASILPTPCKAFEIFHPAFKALYFYFTDIVSDHTVADVDAGRNLESIVDGNNKYSYTYDETGIRTSKTINGKTTYYNTKDGVILSQTDGTNTMYFQYDTNGFPLGFIYNGIQYFYLTNQMGDVIAITDTAGTVIGNYEYDEWGNVTLADTILAKTNPIRYRGYYYDNETSYYYLQSRYYAPEIKQLVIQQNAQLIKQ